MRKLKVLIMISALLSSSVFASGFYTLISQQKIDFNTKICVYKNSLSGDVITLRKQTYEICQNSMYM